MKKKLPTSKTAGISLASPRPLSKAAKTGPVARQKTPLDEKRIRLDFIRLKRVEKALREIETSMKAFIDAVPEPALLITPQGKIILANESISRYLGRKVSHLVGRCAYDFLSPEIAQKRKALIDQACLDKMPSSFEDSRAGPHFINFVTPVPDESGGVSKIAIFALDITDRKRIEAELKYRIGLETIISKISTQFIALPTENMDEAIHIPRVSELPPEACAEQEFIQSRGTQSCIVVPLVSDRQPIGFLGFDSIREEKTWTDEIISFLQIVGEIVVHALQRRKTEEALKKRTEQTIRYQEALLELAKTNCPDTDSALRKIAQTDSLTMGVERVSIWFLSDDRSEIRCRALFKADSLSHEQGLILQANGYPRYFKALEQSRVLAASDALGDPRTNEFAEGYLKPLGISSMMDVPFRLYGELAGIVCHEHRGPKRERTMEEQQFAVSIGTPSIDWLGVPMAHHRLS